MDQLALITKIGSLLNRLKIPYLITGGLAVTIWGRPRFTADIDLVVELTSAQINLLAHQLRQFGKAVYIDTDAMQTALKQRGEFNFLHPDSGLKVDFWILNDQDPFDRQRLERRVAYQLNRTKLFVSSPEDLIIAKLRWFKLSQSTRHLEDIESILAVRGQKLDYPYIKGWVNKDKTANIWRKLTEKTI